MQYGLRSVSMDDIASGLGISKKTIYQYYADKDQLVNEVISHTLVHNQSCCQHDCNCSENAVHEIFLSVDFMIDIFQSMNSSVLFDLQKYHPGAFEKFLQHKNEFVFEMISENLRRGIREGLYRPDINIDILARFRVESTLLPFNPLFAEKVKLSMADIQRELALHFLYGLVTDKGRKLLVSYQQQRTKTI